MPRPRMTVQLAHAIGHDAATRAMRAAGRSVWSAEDYSVYVREFHRVLPCPADEDCDLCKQVAA